MARRYRQPPMMPQLTLDPMEELSMLAPQQQQAAMPPLGMEGLDYMPTIDEPRRRRRDRDGGGSPPLSPEEEQSLLGRTVGGIGWLADSLGKLGYATRGAMMNQPKALLNAIPFYDTVQAYTKDILPEGTLPEAPKPTGWDLGEYMGMPENKPGFDQWDVPKFALEFLDPAMLFTTLPRVAGTTAKGLETASRLAKGADVASDIAKAGTAGERLAQATGGLQSASKGLRPLGSVPGSSPIDIANQIRSGERAMFGLQVPFTKAPFATFGEGSERGAKLVEALGYSWPVKMYRGVMSKQQGVGGVYDARMQRAADEAFAQVGNTYGPAMLNAYPVYREVQEKLRTLFDEAAASLEKQQDVLPFADLTRDIMTTLEKIPDPQGIAQRMAKALGQGFNQPLPQQLEAISTAGEEFHSLFAGLQSAEDAMHATLMAEGIPGGSWKSKFERYGPRLASDPIRAGRLGGNAKRALDAKWNFYQARREHLNLLPNSSVVGNLATRNAALRGLEVLEDGSVRVLKASERKTALELALAKEGILAPPDAKVRALQKLYMQKKYIEPSLNEAVQMGRMTQEDATKYLNELLTAADGKKSGLDKIVIGIAKLPKDTVKTGIWDKDAVTEWFAYMQHGMDRLQTARTTQNFMRQPGVIGQAAEMPADAMPLLQAWKDTGLTPAGMVKYLAETFKIDPKNAMQFAKNLRVDQRAMGTLRHYRDLLKPEVSSKLVQTWDTLQSVFKSWWTVPRFSFHMRNAVGNFSNAAAEGLVDTKPLLNAFVKTHKYIAVGGEKPKYLDEFISLGGLKNTGVEDVMGMRDTLADLSDASLRNIGNDLLDVFRDPIGSTVGKRAVWKTGGVELDALTGKMIPKAQNPILAAGSKMFKMVESSGKVAYYEALREAGYAPAQALHYVERAMFNYSKGSPFARQVGRRVAPFFLWSYNNIPLQLSRLVQRPVGSATGAMLRGLGTLASSDADYVPSFLREGLGVRMPGNDPNQAAFLKQTGLPIEDLNKLVFKEDKLSGTRTASKNFSMLSPFIVAPTEMLLTQKQSYSGRPLRELKSITGVPAVDTALHYSPASSLFGDYSSMADERKTWPQVAANYLTGLKFGTYDPEKSKLAEARAAMMDDLLDNPIIGEGGYPYIRRQYAGTPEAQAALPKLKRLRDLAKLRKQLEKTQ